MLAKRAKNVMVGALLIALGAFVIYRNFKAEPEGDETIPGFE